MERFYRLRYRRTIASSAMLLLYFASAILYAQTKATPADSKAAGGEAVYQARCVLCHGSDGHSQTTLGKQLGAIDLHSPAVQKKTDAELKNVILHGQKNMPPFDGQITSAEIDQVISRVREFGKKKK
jgi:mono/diheme cytochrome c family protein